MARVLLVSHAMPVMQPEAPAELCRLGDDGRAAAAGLPGRCRERRSG
jgi:hypothetical protein